MNADDEIAELRSDLRKLLEVVAVLSRTRVLDDQAFRDTKALDRSRNLLRDLSVRYGVKP